MKPYYTCFVESYIIKPTARSKDQELITISICQVRIQTKVLIYKKILGEWYVKDKRNLYAFQPLDIGYTHPQPMLLALQQDYLNQAIDLCVKTSDYPEESRFRWTLEATYPLLTWLENASDKDIRLVADLIERGQISITASMMHTTPLSDLEEIIRLLGSKEIKRNIGCPITSAINHDVNGQPWPFSQVLLDAGIDFYLTGINIHFEVYRSATCSFLLGDTGQTKLLSHG